LLREGRREISKMYSRKILRLRKILFGNKYPRDWTVLLRTAEETEGRREISKMYSRKILRLRKILFGNKYPRDRTVLLRIAEGTERRRKHSKRIRVLVDPVPHLLRDCGIDVRLCRAEMPAIERQPGVVKWITPVEESLPFLPEGADFLTGSPLLFGGGIGTPADGLVMIKHSVGRIDNIVAALLQFEAEVNVIEGNGEMLGIHAAYVAVELGAQQ